VSMLGACSSILLSLGENGCQIWLVLGTAGLGWGVVINGADEESSGTYRCVIFPIYSFVISASIFTCLQPLISVTYP